MAKQTRARGSRENPLQTNPPPRIPRSAFDRSYSHKTTFDSGLLIPIHVDEILPGDTLNWKPAFLARLATPNKPFIDGLKFDWQAFFIPTRQVWTNFVKQQGERIDPADHNDYTTPQMTPAVGGHLVGSLADYFTMPTEEVYAHSSLFHRAYNHIYNTWYRDADLQDSVVVDLDDGPDTDTDYIPLRRGKRKDYLSGARPFAQRGTAVTLPLGTSAPLQGTAPITGTDAPLFDVGGSSALTMLQGASGSPDVHISASPAGIANLEWNDPKLLQDFSGLTVDLTGATAATISTIRNALATQHVLERDARGGGRYWEVTGAHFGVFPDHIRLTRPELLATGSMSIQTTPVPQTGVAEFGIQTQLGELGAYSVASQVGRGFVKNFEEHGMIMVLASVRADLTYQQGLNRMFSRLTRFDYFLPDFAHIGEQAVLSKEIFADGSANDDDVWGYQPRYEEYRHRDSVITGELRSTFSTSLDIWHLGLDFATRPVLNAAYIVENPPVSRVVLSTAEPEFILDCYFKIKHVRPMPRFGTPGLTRF